MKAGPTVSAVIVASRPGLLARCLESLASAEEPRPLEVLVVLNGSAEACAAAAARFRDRLPALRTLPSPGLPPGAARNLALKAARGELLCFLDDDAAVEPGYFRVLVDKARAYPDAAALGGPEKTPPGSGSFERCVGRALESWVFAGPMRRRAAGFSRDTWTDERGLILCNLTLRADALRAEGLGFDPDLERNEENLLLERLARSGRRAVHCPDLRVYHQRRSGPAGFFRQCRLSGRGRAAMTFRLPGTLRAVHVLPGAAALAALLAPLRPGAAAAAAAVYLAVVAAEGIALAAAQGESWTAAAWHVFLVAAGHASYGAGLLEGFVREIFRPAPSAPGLGRAEVRA